LTKSEEESLAKEIKQKTKDLRALGYKIPLKTEKIQLESLMYAKRISDSIRKLEDVNEKVSVAKAVTSLLIGDLGLNYNGRLLMLSEIFQTEIGLNIYSEQNGEQETSEIEADWPKKGFGPSYVSWGVD